MRFSEVYLILICYLSAAALALLNLLLLALIPMAIVILLWVRAVRR